MFTTKKTLLLVSVVIVITGTVSTMLASFYFAAEEKEAVDFWMNESSKYYKEMMRLREQLAKYDKKFAENLTKERRMANTNLKTGNADNQGELKQQASAQDTKDKYTRSKGFDSSGIIILVLFAVSIIVLFLYIRSKDK